MFGKYQLFVKLFDTGNESTEQNFQEMEEISKRNAKKILIYTYDVQDHTVKSL